MQGHSKQSLDHLPVTSSTFRPNSPSSADILALAQAAVQSGELSRQTYSWLASALLANADLTGRDRAQINRLFDAVRSGRLKLVD